MEGGERSLSKGCSYHRIDFFSRVKTKYADLDDELGFDIGDCEKSAGDRLWNGVAGRGTLSKNWRWRYTSVETIVLIGQGQMRCWCRGVRSRAHFPHVGQKFFAFLLGSGADVSGHDLMATRPFILPRQMQEGFVISKHIGS